MAKAHYTTKSGAVVTIEGTPQEVAELVAQLEGTTPRKAENGAPARKGAAKGKALSKPTPVTLISELIDGGFFKKPKGLGEIKSALEESGHFYPVTSLSPTVLRFVRKRQLRRIKENKRWLYVG
jgi:hypothetical protein